MIVLILVVLAYLIGSIPFGLIVGRMRGFDPRAAGSGNIGMTNVARTGGGIAAALTFLGDVLKGVVPVAFVKHEGFHPAVIAAVALAAFIGAIYSVFLGFKGGKGISAALGTWLVISPATILVALAAFVIVAAATRIISLASISAAFVLPPAAAAFTLPRHYLLLAILMTALALLRHRENIARLMRGEEKPFTFKSRAESAPG
jgi:acyl phosphate:glycerol-3-phosphate acyltransferase